MRYVQKRVYLMLCLIIHLVAMVINIWSGCSRQQPDFMRQIAKHTKDKMYMILQNKGRLGHSFNVKQRWQLSNSSPLLP